MTASVSLVSRAGSRALTLLQLCYTILYQEGYRFIRTYTAPTDTNGLQPALCSVASICTLNDDLSRALSPVQPFPLDDHVSVVVLPPEQSAVLREALNVRQHRGFVLGGSRDGADLFEEFPEGLQKGWEERGVKYGVGERGERGGARGERWWRARGRDGLLSCVCVPCFITSKYALTCSHENNVRVSMDVYVMWCVSFRCRSQMKCFSSTELWV